MFHPHPLLSISIQDWFPILVLQRSLWFDKPPRYFSHCGIEVSYVSCLACLLCVIGKRLHVAPLILPNILLDGSMCIIVIFLCLSLLCTSTAVVYYTTVFFLLLSATFSNVSSEIHSLWLGLLGPRIFLQASLIVSFTPSHCLSRLS